MKNMITIISAFALVALMATTAQATKTDETENLGSSYSCSWYEPSGTPPGWVLLQHGYSRSRSNMDDMATDLEAAGLLVLACDISVDKNKSSWGPNIANSLMQTDPTPPNKTLPNKLVLMGHSAGGWMLALTAGTMCRANYGELAGTVLLDPVDGSSGRTGDEMKECMDRGVPAYAILAKSNSCNDSNNVLDEIEEMEGDHDFAGIQLMDASSHLDFEGTSGGGGFGGMCPTSQTYNQNYAKEFAVAYAEDMIDGTKTTAYYPGGSEITDLLKTTSSPYGSSTVADGRLLLAYSGPSCGNGIVDGSEECDGGACCDSSCELRVSGFECRASTDGDCDPAEECTGANAECPADDQEDNGTSCGTGMECWGGDCIVAANCGNDTVETGEECDGDACCTNDCRVASSGTVCRSDAGQCDVAEVCDGYQLTCPSDASEPDGTACTSGVCQSGTCTSQSTGWVTPLDESSLTQAAGDEQYFNFTAPAGATEVEVSIDVASGDPDLHVKKDAAVSTSAYDCRPYKGSNTDETCEFAGSGTYYVLVDKYSDYECDLTGKYMYPGADCGNGIVDSGEECDGGTCCEAPGTANECEFRSSSDTCRAANGSCDNAETCTGSSAACPADAFKSSYTTCRSDGADVDASCDVADTCTGSDAACPVDEWEDNGTYCASGKECIDGYCVNEAGPTCGNSIVETGEDCDGGDCCDSSCEYKSSSTTCRIANGDCDNAETCTGSSAACPADAFKSSSTVCRADAGSCDLAENCTGSSAVCPSDACESDGTSCGTDLECDSCSCESTSSGGW